MKAAGTRQVQGRGRAGAQRALVGLAVSVLLAGCQSDARSEHGSQAAAAPVPACEARGCEAPRSAAVRASGPDATRAASTRGPDAAAVASGSGAPPLPALQRARLEYLFAAGTLLEKQWPAIATDPPCVLLAGLDAVWLVGCKRAPAGGGFDRLQETLRGLPVYARRGGSFALGGETLSTRALIERAPATAHVEPQGAASQGASSQDVLPADEGLLLVGTLRAIRGLRTDFAACTTDEWLSVALHELVHVWQLRAPSFAPQLRAIDRGELTPDGLRALYANDPRYRALVRREYRLLVRAVSTELAAAEAQRVLRAWHGLYRARVRYLKARADGAALLQAEHVFGYLEGVARYVESRFLVDATLHPPLAIAGDAEFHAFARYEGRGYGAMQNRQLDPEYHYALGFHLALLLDALRPGWRDEVATHPGWLIGLAEDLAAGAQ